MTVLENIPEELRQLNQWVCSNDSKMPIDPKTNRAASVTDPSTWGTFEQAANAGHPYIGLVFTADDPYVFIDLDTGKQPDYAQLHYQIITDANGFAETSKSGMSYHVVVKGALSHGLRDDKKGIEIYPHSRFMLVTGNVIPPSKTPIENNQALLNFLADKINRTRAVVQETLDSQEEIMDDESLIESITNAVNGEKFNALMTGEWRQFPEYQDDHSRADLGLLTFLDFHSKNVEQVIRIFKSSAIYRSTKGRANTDGTDYIIRTLKRARGFNEQSTHSEEEIERLKASAGQMIERYKQSLEAERKSPSVAACTLPKVSPPPGLVGEIANYIYSSAIRPIAEASVMGAIALVAGLAGRQYNISGTGLNQYLILLAPTGSGKEGAASGITRLLHQVRLKVPSASQFKGASEISSGQALLKALPKQPCQFSILGEFGLRMQQMSDPRANGAEKKLQQVLLDLYNKSGHTDELGDMIYSDSDKNVSSVQSPALTILGESTPETFFAKLTEEHILSGLLPRFLFLEYAGNRAPKNKTMAFHDPSEQLVQRVADLAETVIRMQTNNTVCQVQVGPEAQTMLDAFDLECDKKVDEGTELYKNLWSRADLMVIRLSGLLAVGDNHMHPVVTPAHVQWATQFVKHSVELIASRFAKGLVGDGESTYENVIVKVIEEYWQTSEQSKLSTYRVSKKIVNEPVIPYTYLRRRLKRKTAFQNDRKGTVPAIKSAIQDLCEAQILVKIPPSKVQEQFGLSTELYTIGPAWNGE